MADSMRVERDILEAALRGDVPTLKRLADENGYGKLLVKLVDGEERNALHLAAGNGRTPMCRFLIKNLDFNINSRDCRGNTPLIAAIEREKHSTAVFLIEKGAHVGLLNVAGCGALHSAATTGQTEIMRLLLSRGVPNLNSGKVYTPLQCACHSGNKKAVKLLLDHGADPNATVELYESALMISIGHESLECMELLLKAGADPDLVSSGRTALTFAACKGNTKIIKRLLKAGANPDVVESGKLMTPLEVAACYRHVDAVKLLFPVTSRIPSVSDWSVDGIMKLEHAFSGEGLKQMLKRQTDYFEMAKAKGKEAFERKKYLEAVGWYTRAEKANPISMDVVSNRSLCWAKLNLGEKALEDAKMCVGVQPDWYKGYYRLGAARMLLHEYSKAVEAFAKALELDPKNKDIKKAHREAVEAELDERMSGASIS